jgi:Damage-control phosphatase ARMT1-like domain
MRQQDTSPTPAELLNSDPFGFAWGVWHDRTPKLVTQIRDAHPYGPAQRSALDSLLAEITSGVMEPLGPHAYDHRTWASWGAEHFGRPWLDAPFLWSESYFYRRLLDAVRFFEPGPWRCFDPFEYLKTAELRDPALEADLAALGDLQQLSVGEQEHAKLLAALWGNRADLGFRMSSSAGAGDDNESAVIITDQSAGLSAALGQGASVILVADNAGRELLADLVLIDHLLQHGRAASVSLHVKPHPYYVSDATTADVAACLRRLAATPGSSAEVAHRLHAAMTDGIVSLYTHEFYCAPWSFHRAPEDLAGEFKRASLTILKGDLNYRRLVGDRDWPPATPFAAVTSYFPGTVAVLRTLKSDVITGLDPAAVADMDAAGQPWRTDGKHGLIQFHQMDQRNGGPPSSRYRR